METTYDRPQIGTFKRNWLIFKSSWRILTLDKELLVIPLIAMISGLLVLGAGAAAGLLINGGVPSVEQFTNDNQSLSPALYGVLAAVGALTTLIGVYTSAALSVMTLERLRGGDPTLKSGFSVVRTKFVELTAFGLFSFGVIQLIHFISERIPGFGGQLIGWLGETAWNIANFFSVLVIADSNSDSRIWPITAAKNSLQIIRHSWRDAAVNRFGLGLISTLVAVPIILGGLFGSVGLYLADYKVAGISFGASTVLILLVVFFIVSALEGIAKAALYYYATSGEAPEKFDARLMKEAFTPKKAKKIFS